jgi:linoleoyl-CoA desaturase
LATAPRLTLGALRKEFQSRNWHRKATGPVVRELIVHSAFAVFGAVIALQAETTWMFLVGAVISALGTTGVTTNTHTSTHFATADSKRVNRFLAGYGYPLFAGLSMTYWHRAHIEVHHPNPNIHGVDDDHDFMPFFVTQAPELERVRGGWRTYYEKFQTWVFPFMVWLHVFTRQKSSFVHIFRNLFDREKRSGLHVIDLVLMLSHYALWIGVPALFVGVEDAALLYFTRQLVLGYVLYAILAPAHYVPEAVCIEQDGRPTDPVLLQTATTVNFRTGAFGRLLCSGLDYQIEHHLFPSYSHVHYPKMSPYVREFCRQNGYPYRTLGWPEAVLKTMAMLRRPKPVEPVVEKIPAEAPHA